MITQEKYNQYLIDREKHEAFWNQYKLQFTDKFLVSPHGKEFEIITITNLKDFCREHGHLSSTVMLQLIKGKISKYLGWTIKKF